jgi:hypothetical protein
MGAVFRAEASGPASASESARTDGCGFERFRRNFFNQYDLDKYNFLRK